MSALRTKRCLRARRGTAVSAAAALLLPAFAGGQEEAAGPVVPPALRTQSIEVGGLSVEMSVTPLAPEAVTSGVLHEGQDVRVAFRIRDTATGTPQKTLEPAGWIHKRDSGQDCVAKVEGFLSGGLGTRAETDLNVFYVVTLNDDSSLSVVDPLFGFGGSKLLDLVVLSTPGEDWAMTADQERIFVSLPRSQAVAAVDTSTWQNLVEIRTAPTPVAIALQPDEQYLWVACDGESEADPRSGVTVIDVRTLERVTDLPTGAGHHEIAFSDDSRWAFVTNEADGTLSVVDTWKLDVVKQCDAGQRPVAVAWSPLAKAVYVVDGEGAIRVFDGRSHEQIALLETEPGAGELTFAPGGRLGFLANPEQDLVHIVDSASHRIVQTGEVGQRPDQVTFTESLAYVRSLESEIVWMIPLAEVGREGAPVPIVDFPGGQVPFGTSTGPASANGIVAAPGGTAVLVAHPADRSVYYYREGMAAPMGHFKTYRREPRAVLVVDRSLRESEPGVYSTDVRLRSHGAQDVVFFLDSPRVVHCFSLDVEPAPDARDERPGLRVEALLESGTLAVGTEVALRFRVTRRAGGAPATDLRDLGVLAFDTGGWQRREWAAHTGEGVYETAFTPPRSGTYYVFVQCPSEEIALNSLPPVILRAVEPAAQTRTAGGETR